MVIKSQDLVIDAFYINLKMRHLMLGRIEHQGAADRNSPSDTGSAPEQALLFLPKTFIDELRDLLCRLLLRRCRRP